MIGIVAALVGMAAVLAASALSGAEAGLVGVNRIHLRHLVKSGDIRARRLALLLRSRERVFAATIPAGAALLAAAASLAAAAFAALGAEKGVAAAAVVVAAAFYVLGKAAPRWYVRGRADHIMLRFATPLAWLTRLLAPLRWIVQAAGWLGFRLLRAAPRPIFPAREEVASRGRERGRERAEPGRRRVEAMLGSVFHFGLTSAREVMIPFPDVVGIEEAASPSELLDLVRREGHTRIPVYQERVDQIVGFVNVFDVLYDASPRAAVRDYVRPIPITPDTKRIDRLMVELQRQREPLAVVVNEFGTCVGIVSLEDIIEEIMGDITDEHEETERRIRMIAPGVFHVDAKTDVDDINQELELDLPKEGYDTVGGLLLKRFGRIPKPGDATAVQGVRFEVLEVYRYGVRLVKVTIGGGEP